MVGDRGDSVLPGPSCKCVAVPFFGGIPVTGVIARTATNVRNGATSPIAGITHALTLLLIVLLAAPLAKFIPLTVLGAVLIVVALRMGEWDEFLLLKKQAGSDAALLVEGRIGEWSAVLEAQDPAGHAHVAHACCAWCRTRKLSSGWVPRTAILTTSASCWHMRS